MKRITCTFILLAIFLGCVAHPRYTIKTQEEYPSNVSKINRDKMGRILKSFIGVPYKDKGLSHLGVDCSGLVVEVYRRYNGTRLPHDTEKLFKLAKKVKRPNLAYGDLIFFTTDFKKISHVGIYLDNGDFVHSSESQGVVISSLKEPYYNRRYMGGRRVIP